MEAVDKISVGVSKEKAGQNTQEAITENADGMKVSLGEKICYGVGDIGANLVWTTVASFLTIYCTDVAGIAAGVVGTLMLIARLFDGVSDLFMGIIIDKTNTRWGKARPWVLWSAPPLVISLIMIFTVPDLGANGKAIYLYCNGTPSVDDYTKTEEQVNECRQYTVEDLFCCAYAPFFWQAIQIRYPEYATYNRELYALFGGAD